jgi:hypothetical protein
VQEAFEVQLTAFSWLSANPVGPGVEGLGVLRIVQLDPSQRSAKGAPNPPTAMQDVAELHDTPKRLSPGADWTLHCVPSHRSTSSPGLESRDQLPTAVHAVGDVQLTAFSWLGAAPLGFGVVWSVQLVPSQRSAIVAGGIVFMVLPTAVQALLDVQDTPARESSAGAGTVSAVQVLPFQCSAKADNNPLKGGKSGGFTYPTAVHEVEEAQETWVKMPPGAAVCTVQVAPSQRSASEVSRVIGCPW